MTATDETGALDPRPATDDAVPGEIVRDLVARNEEAIADLEARLTLAEAEAAASERAVRRHPALVLLPPDEARQLLPAAPRGPRPPSPGATTVVRRAPTAPAAAAPPSATPAPDGPPLSLGSRLVRSHWWWRVGIVLVLVAVVLLKVG